MDVPLTNYVTKLNKLSYKDQCMYINKKLLSMEPDDISYHTFFKKLQMMVIDLPGIFNDFIKNISIGDIVTYNCSFNSCMFDDYLFHEIKAHISIFYKRLKKDEYLVNIPVKGSLKDITTIIKIIWEQ